MSEPRLRCPTCGKIRFRGGQPRVHGLTQMQWNVATQVYAGKSYKEIAEFLQLSEKTVKQHACGVHRAWGVKSKAGVIMRMFEIKTLANKNKV